MIDKLGLRQTPSDSATNQDQARRIAERIGYPVVVRPSFVLGGRAMEIVYDEPSLARYMAEAVDASPEKPILIDKFLEDATEVDVDAVCDGERTIVGGVMEHIEEAGIHSGDSACAIPPFSLSPEIVARLKEQTVALAEALKVRGLMNIQFAVKDGEIYVLEVNPRASRTVPFVSKATGLNLAQAAARVMVGKSLAEQGITSEQAAEIRVGEGVGLPVREVPRRGHRARPRDALDGRGDGDRARFRRRRSPRASSARRASCRCPGTVFVSVAARDRKAVVPIAAKLSAMGYDLMCTGGTAAALAAHGIAVTTVRKIHEGRPNLLDHLANDAIALIVNTPSGKGARTDEGRIRASAVCHGVPCITTINAAKAAVVGHGAAAGGGDGSVCVAGFAEIGFGMANHGRSPWMRSSVDPFGISRYPLRACATGNAPGVGVTAPREGHARENRRRSSRRAVAAEWAKGDREVREEPREKSRRSGRGGRRSVCYLSPGGPGRDRAGAG